MALRRTTPPVVGAIALLLLVAAAGVPILALLPAVLLIGFLGLGRERGEAALGRLCSRFDRRRARPPRSLAAPRRRFCARVPRGTALLARGLAVRPPPPKLLSV
ncbi:MAG: hypothetical protein U0R51_02250 [Solirubrobacterales bacterium]